MIVELDKKFPTRKGWLKPVKIMRRVLNRHGYVIIWVVDHHIVGTCKIPEHRLVLSEKLGRKLKKNEVPHHDRIRDKTFNHPKNLILMTKSSHMALHNRERIFSKETILKKSIAMIGNKHLLGHKHSRKTRAKMSKSHTGVKRGPYLKQGKQL